MPSSFPSVPSTSRQAAGAVDDPDVVFTAFREDPDWTALLAKYPVPLSIEAFMLSASDYSALK